MQTNAYWFPCSSSSGRHLTKYTSKHDEFYYGLEFYETETLDIKKT